jgi:hypothetical protein
MVSLDHLENRLSEAQILLYLKEELLLMISILHEYDRNIYYMNFYNQ